MTTIAWDGKELASDSMVYSDYIEQSPIKKIFKKDGKLFAFAGVYAESIAFLNEGKKLTDESQAIEIDLKTGKAKLHEGSGCFDIKPPQALGSGAPFAMGAMLAGKSATEAVKIGIKLDPYSGGKVSTHKITK